MSKCQRIRHLIGPYLYDDVSAKERAAVESHLQQCAACREEVKGLRGLITAIPSDTMRPDVRAKARTLHVVQSRIAEGRARRVGWRRWRETVFVTALLTGAALLLSFWPARRPPPPVPPPAPRLNRDVQPQPGPVVAPTEVVDSGQRNEAVARPRARHGGHGARVRRPGNDLRSRLKKQFTPPAFVEAALVVPAPVAAPAVTGVDDVTQAPVAPGQE